MKYFLVGLQLELSIKKKRHCALLYMHFLQIFSCCVYNLYALHPLPNSGDIFLPKLLQMSAVSCGPVQSATITS